MPRKNAAPKKTATESERAALLTKVQALLARAADPGASEEERRTSAVIAAKLMRQHGLSVGDGVPSARASVPGVPEAAEEMVPDIRRALEEHAQNATELASVIFGGDGPAPKGGLLGLLQRTVAAVDRDVTRVRSRAPRRA